MFGKSEASGLRKTTLETNSLAHRTAWLRGTVTKKGSGGVRGDCCEKIDSLLKETLEIVDNLRLTSEESVSRSEDMNKFLSEELNNCNKNIVLLDEKLPSDI